MVTLVSAAEAERTVQRTS